MCNPISFSMRRAAGKPPTFLLHLTKPLRNHSHTAIANSHGFSGLEHDVLIKWEYRPFVVRVGIKYWLKGEEVRPDTTFELIKDSHHAVTGPEWNAALDFAKSLVPRYLKMLARNKIAEARREKAQARRDARALREKERLDRRQAALNHKRHTSNNIHPVTDLRYDSLFPHKPCAWTRRFKLHKHRNLLIENVNHDGSWRLNLYYQHLPTTNNLNREVLAFLIRTTSLPTADFNSFVLAIYPNQITAPNHDLWFRELVRLIGYTKPIPGGSGF